MSGSVCRHLPAFKGNPNSAGNDLRTFIEVGGDQSILLAEGEQRPCDLVLTKSLLPQSFSPPGPAIKAMD